MNGQDGPTDVAVHVAMRDDEARASVRVADGADLPESARRAALARAWLVVAEVLSGGDPDAAATAARRGLDELGDEYVDPEDTSTVDDTGMKVGAARATDVPSERAALLIRSLEARLQMYAWRYEDRRLAFEPPLEVEASR